MLLVVEDGRVRDADTGEVWNALTLDILLRGSGMIAGCNLYPILAALQNDVRATRYWSLKIHTDIKRGKVAKGIIHIAHISYVRKVKKSGKDQRERRKWIVTNIELFTESRDIEKAARALIDLADSRGVKPRYSPGSYGSALLRASPEWEPRRRPAPRFISEAARTVLPGNYYARRNGYRRVKRAYYLDQRSAHHTIAATVPLPHPHHLHGRGRLKRVQLGGNPKWQASPLAGHIGVIVAEVKCNPIHPDQLHLYPQWAREKGIHTRWVWTPELRILNDSVSIIHVSAALTSVVRDPAITEYAVWALKRLREHPDSVIKPALLAAYGMLAINPTDEFTNYAVHGREKPPRAESVTLPLLPAVYRSTVERTRTPTIQNVVARGVIEAEVRTRSIELARRLESEGFPVVHIYADGLIVATDQLPFLPDGWRVVSPLTDVSSPAPHSILSAELVRLPGIPDGRRMAYIRPDEHGLHLRENEPPVVSSVW